MKACAILGIRSLGVYNLPFKTQGKDFNDFVATRYGVPLRNVNCVLREPGGLAKLEGFENYDDF